MLDKVQELQQDVNSFSATSLEELEDFRISFLGKKGKVTLLFNEFRNVPNDQKKEFGGQLNKLKKSAQNKIIELKQGISSSQKHSNLDIDLTAPAQPYELGSRHPISIVKNEIIDEQRIIGQQWKKVQDFPLFSLFVTLSLSYQSCSLLPPLSLPLHLHLSCLPVSLRFLLLPLRLL